MDEPEVDYITYEEFGRRFIEHAVSAERVRGALSELAGSSFQFGPIGAGPGRIAKISADVDLGDIEVERFVLEEVNFELVIPIKVHLVIDLALDVHRFDVDGNVHVRLRARTAAPLRVIVEVEPSKKKDVRIDVAPQTIRGGLLRIVASVDQEIKRFVVKYINKEIEKPHIQAARDIDVADRIDKAWAHSASTLKAE
jgi:hypothetical protein